MTLDGVVLVAAYSSRSQAYAQAMAARGISPARVLLFGDAARRRSAASVADTAPPRRPADTALPWPDLSIPLEETCRLAGWEVEFLPTGDINEEQVHARLQELRPALMIYSGYGGQIVRPPLLGLAPLLHVHSGWLPDYRGSTTLYYSLLADRQCAASALLLEQEIDAGPIIARRHYPVPPADIDIDHLFDGAIRADLLVRVLEDYARDGRLPRVDPDSQGAGRTYYVIHPVLKHLSRISTGADFHFGTKAETLERLQPLVTRARLLPQVYFSVADWRRDRGAVLDRLCGAFTDGKVAVRSSARSEDGDRQSMAGAFTTCLNKDVKETGALSDAIDTVIRSYADDPGNQVLVQPMLERIAVSGVIMTHEIEHGAPYRVLEYDDLSGRTDTITGGTGAHKTVMIHRHEGDRYIRSERIADFSRLAAEIETVCGSVPVDIEFALSTEGVLYLLQVRRISLRRNWHPGTDKRVTRQLTFLEQFIAARSRRRPGIYGSRTILGSMPDWNPAELIGTMPRPLAMSLFRHLITRHIWRDARTAMGYHRLPPEELMVVVGGHPLIDTRNSFNSFLPHGIDDDTGEALIDAWLQRLDRHPELHDKVEFEIASTCVNLDFDALFDSRYPGLLDADRLATYREQLTALTRRALDLDDRASLPTSVNVTRRLANRRPAGALPAAGQEESLLAAARLIEKCRVGTLHFSIIARHAFIAEALLRSAVARGALQPERFDRLKRSIPTITRELTGDFIAARQGKLDPAVFLEKYGHLRPGTYDITSLCYRERDDLLSPGRTLQVPEPETFELSPREKSAIDSLLAEAGFDGIEAAHLLRYAGQAIAGREYNKFVFTRDLSGALQSLIEWGKSAGLDRDDLSYLQWPDLDDALTRPLLDHADRHFMELAARGRRDEQLSRTLKISHLVRGVEDLYVVPIHRSRPNFIGKGRAEGDAVKLDAHTPSQVELGEKIVCIENADPGFDWIFGRGIAALVTKFGGPNSHMAIRCAEFGLPASIGCGERTFDRIVEAGRVELDCAARTLRPVFHV